LEISLEFTLYAGMISHNHIFPVVDAARDVLENSLGDDLLQLAPKSWEEYPELETDDPDYSGVWKIVLDARLGSSTGASISRARQLFEDWTEGSNKAQFHARVQEELLDTDINAEVSDTPFVESTASKNKSLGLVVLILVVLTLLLIAFLIYFSRFRKGGRGHNFDHVNLEKNRSRGDSMSRSQREIELSVGDSKAVIEKLVGRGESGLRNT